MAGTGSRPDTFATSGDIQAAIEALTAADTIRLRKAARVLIPGTEYAEPQELINEVLVRAMQGAIGQPGRRWPKSRVPFLAFVIETMKSLVSDSRESAWMSRSEALDETSAEAAGEAIAATSSPSIEHELLELAARDAAEQRKAQAAAKIEKFFEHDEEVSLMWECLKEGMIGAEVIATCGFRDQTHYETVRRRFRRGIEKLFPERRST